jgi:hypothetical protein
MIQKQVSLQTELYNAKEQKNYEQTKQAMMNSFQGKCKNSAHMMHKQTKPATHLTNNTQCTTQVSRPGETHSRDHHQQPDP